MSASEPKRTLTNPLTGRCRPSISEAGSMKARILIMFSAFASLPALGKDSTASPICWPLNFAGVTLSVTTDAQAQRLLGKGISQASADEKVRFYLDKSKMATLRIVSYTDDVVGEITVEQGISALPNAADQNQAVSPWFDPAESFGVWHKLRLGSSKAEVRENLGAPQQITPDTAWVYTSTCTCEVPQHVSVYFKGEHVNKIVFSGFDG